MCLSYRNNEKQSSANLFCDTAHNGIMTARIKLNSVLLPLLAVGLLVMQLLDPSKIWQALIVAFGGLW
jgi:hypothetical protein